MSNNNISSVIPQVEFGVGRVYKTLPIPHGGRKAVSRKKMETRVQKLNTKKQSNDIEARYQG